MFRTIENHNVISNSRTWLNHLTEFAKKTRDDMLANACNEREAFKALSLSINDILLCIYQDMTNVEEWRTLQEWEKHGYSLKKNSRPFYVWGQRIDLLEKIETIRDEVTRNLTVMTVYNRSQVERSERDSDFSISVDDANKKQRRKKFDYISSFLSIDTGSKVETLLRVKNEAICGTIKEIKRNEVFIVGCDGFNLLVFKDRGTGSWQVIDLDSGEKSILFDRSNLFKAVDDIAAKSEVIAS